MLNCSSEEPGQAEERFNRDLMKLQKDKRKLSHPGRKKSLATAQSEQWPAGQQLCRKGPGDPGGQRAPHEPCVPWQQTGSSLLGCTNRARASGGLTTFSALVRPHQILCSELAAPEHDKLEQGQERATMRGVRAFHHEERLRESGLFSLEKERLQHNNCPVLSY